MSKIKGWKKLDDLVWQSENKDDVLGLYQYIWVDARNRVRRGYSQFAQSKLSLQIVQNSEILSSATSEKTAKDYVVDYMRKVRF